MKNTRVIRRLITTLAAARMFISELRIRGCEEKSWRREVEKRCWRCEEE